ncbi:hypothetical protein [Picrophilus oshimae]|uniref:Thermopsin n=1 Tax=Picrophilus torridus (strain ATCC 700027 / DSM 9790 / JCM 10055 / NBRC 100828 / KAW 2/3) TaxID=1122961 RepID=A0A8G2FVM4_PICTO|nr:hypothetical protein [Picrophilus oshimae]SMD30332.1 hypothetical protein SAMN02745355_0207 [Picrophilus oshimae DSM 9789]
MKFLTLILTLIIISSLIYTGNIYKNNGPDDYRTTFIEHGLPEGTEWYVNITCFVYDSGNVSIKNFTIYSINSTIIYYSLNGSLNYYNAYAEDSRYISSGGSYFATKNITENITFNYGYSVTFSEHGLPPWDKWYVSGSFGMTFPTSCSSISFLYVKNGSYSYHVSWAGKNYRPVNENGNFTVNGSNATVNIFFNLIKYNVTFIEIGLARNYTWHVDFKLSCSNYIFTSTGNKITVKLANGVYNYNITSKNYIAFPAMGHVNVNGGNINIILIFIPDNAPDLYNYIIIFNIISYIMNLNK